MMARQILAAASLALLLGTVTAQGAEEPGLGLGTRAGDNDPEVKADEIHAPAVEAEDGWGERGSPWTWFEDPASVDCAGRRGCDQAVANETARRGDAR